MKLVVTDKTPIAADTVRVRLARPDGEALAGFAPGAHVELAFGGMVRRYSLTCPVDQPDYREISVLLTDPSAGGSAYIHTRLAIGQTINVSDPRAAFPLAMDAAHSVFIAGGIGITPFLTMMKALQDAGASFELHYAARDDGRFLPLPVGLPAGTRYVDRNGRPELVVADLLDRQDRNAHLYVCGPRSLIEAVRIGAAERGWPSSHIHFESFGPAPKPSDRPLTVHLVHSGTSIEVDPGTTVLDALLDAGVWAPFDCRRGECGSCHVPVERGEIDHRDVCLTPRQRDEGMCTCVSWGRSREIALAL